jgi:hypothetical protein
MLALSAAAGGGGHAVLADPLVGDPGAHRAN